jgi:subtilisin-like proprotein convertase family protein
VSPLNRSNALDFSDGWFYKRVFDANNPSTFYKKIPQVNSANISEDTMKINLNSQISDINLFVGINHTNEQDLQIKLYSPGGDSVTVFAGTLQAASNNNVVTIFDDNADSILQNNRYVSFGPVIKPLNSMNSVFTGKQSQGIWKIRIYDNNTQADTGIFYSWGIQLNKAINIVKEYEEIPAGYRLSQNYPNPFNPVTYIKFQIPEPGNVSIKIYSITGAEIARVVNEYLNRGVYTVEWDASDYASGAYFYKIIAKDFMDVKKMILIK